MVPVGGSTELKVSLHPQQVIKFDSHLMVSFRNWKTLDLRIGGVVEPPSVELDVGSFKIGGCYCGSMYSAPFKIINRASSEARIEFNLTRYPDFAIKSVDPAIQMRQSETNYFTIILEGYQAANCELEFKPTEVGIIFQSAQKFLTYKILVISATPSSPSQTKFKLKGSIHVSENLKMLNCKKSLPHSSKLIEN